MHRHRSRQATLAVTTALVGAIALALSGCASADPLDSGTSSESGGSGDTIVIGSQDYYSNEIIAEIYAQALEAADHTLDRQFR